MKLNLINEIKNCLGEVSGFCVSVYFNGGYFCGVKKIVEYSLEKVVLKVEGDKMVTVLGENLKIIKLTEGDLTFKGKIKSVTVE